jgi:hypothetical protein
MSDPVQPPTRPARAALAPALAPPAPADTTPEVSPRAGATPDSAVVRLREHAAIKHNLFAGREGLPSGRAHWQTHLHVEAWVRNTTYAKHVFGDVHVFGHDGALVASQTCAFTYERPAGDGGDVFRLDCVVYEGATATPGSATPRPDVRLVQHRLYVELDGQVYTDGRLHECALRSDVVTP